MKRLYFSTFMLALVAAGSFVFTGCGSTEEPEPATAKIKFVNAAPASSGLDVTVDGDVFANNRQFGMFTTYLERNVGDAGTLVFKLMGTGTSNVLAEKNLTVSADKSYTLIAINDTAGTYSLLNLNDDLSAPAAGKSLYRAINLINDSRKVRVAFRGSGLKALYDSISFGQITEFFNEVDAQTYTLRFMSTDSLGAGNQQGGFEPILEQNVNLVAGKAYTFALTGTMANPTLTLITHDN